MISFPNGKINIGLQITSKRNDGFHDIVSCFYPVPWSDVLEIIPSDELSFTSTGINIPGEGNLCLQAYQLLKKDFGLPLVKIHLHKIIPIGAGLGGGSSDAAFTIKMLNEMFSLDLSMDQMEEYARRIGSDCAFFIQNKPQLCLEKGDAFENINLNLKGKFIVMIYPDLHISTQEAYAGVIPQEPTVNLKSILENHPITQWGSVVNDFEASLFPNHPELDELKTMLRKKGALYASMSGSGSAVYGIFDTEVKIESSFTSYSAKL